MIDLVQAAGVDVRRWADYAGGEAHAASNPKYCFRWAFLEQDTAVFNLWYTHLKEENGIILCDFNLRPLGIVKPRFRRKIEQFERAAESELREKVFIASQRTPESRPLLRWTASSPARE